MAPRKKPASPAPPPKPTPPPPIPNSPEQFEAELKALAAKARTETPLNHILEQLTIYLKSSLLLSLIAIFSRVSQLTLSPTYGSIPSAKWHSKLVIAACFVGWSSNLALNRALPFKPEKLLPILAVYVPVIQYFLGEQSEKLTASWGPLITELVTLFPMVAISAGCVATYLDGVDLGFLPKWLGEALPGLGSYGFFKGSQKVLGGLVDSYIGKTAWNTRIGMEATLAGGYSAFAPSKLLLWTALPGVLHTALFNTHAPSPNALERLNNGLGKVGYVVLDREESITGYVSVIDSPKEGYRLMRCDHSLLGGEWTKFIGQPQFRGNQVAEPIYGVFAMLEAVRLVETEKRIKDQDAKALVM